MNPSRNLLPSFARSRTRGTMWRLLLALIFALSCYQVPRPAWADAETHHRGVDGYEYDAAGRLFRVTYHTGRITTFAFDMNSKVLSVTESLSPTGVEEEPAPPRVFSLSRAHPNPGQAARFTFSLPHAARVTVRLFDISGRLVATVVEGDFGPGPHRVELPSGRWAAGVYYYRLDTPGFSKVQKFVHLK